MKFRPFDKKIENVFGARNRYIIPNFQRDYSWEQRNYEDFINDLLFSCGAKVDSNGINSSDVDIDYFFGTLLVVGDESKPDINNPYIVVDGQQRLTTMTLFFAAILNRIAEIDKTYKNDYKVRLSFEDTKDGKSQEYLRIINKNLNPILPVNILNLNNQKSNGANHRPSTNAQEWLMDSYNILYEMLGKDSLVCRLTKDNQSEKYCVSDENYIRFLDKLGRQLSNSTVIIIFSEDEKSANILYRNFNYRGKPLSQPDLIKNELFSILDDESESIVASWKEMERNIYNANEEISSFFYHYMIGKYKNITQKNLFEVFMDSVDAKPKKYTEFINNLKLNSEYYRAIIAPEDDMPLFGKENYFKRDDNPLVKRNLILLKEIEATQVRIILLSLFDSMMKNKINSANFRKMIDLIALNQSLHVLATSPANKLTSIYKKYSKRLIEIKDNNEVQSIIKNLLEDFSNKLPSKEEVLKSDVYYDHKKHIIHMNAVQKKNRALVRHILCTLSVKNQSSETQKGNDGLEFIYNSTIDHIIDQKNKLNNVMSLGNLILLERSEHNNSENKCSMYEKSKITLTKNFFSQYNIFETEEHISHRREKLLSEYYDYIKNIK